MINLYDLLCSLQCIIKLNEGGRGSQTERDWKRQRHRAASELRYNRRGPSFCTAERTGRHSFEWKVWNGQPPKSVGVVFSRRNAIKIPKSSMCSALWNMTYGTAKTELADVLSPQNGLLLSEAQFPIREVYENMTPLWKSHPTIHRRLSLPPACFWWAAIIFIPRSRIDVCNWSSNLWSGLGAG